MQWCVEVPSSSSSFPKTSFLLLSMILFHLPSSVQSLPISACSPYLYVSEIDTRINNQHIQPCPVSSPCQCICEIESKRLWIDCFYRKLKTLPTFERIPTNNTVIEWNIDFAFNLFEQVTTTNNKTEWLPENMHIRHMVLSSSLAYDLIVQLNITHRHLLDTWPSQEHLPIIDDRYQPFDDYQNDKADDLSDVEPIKPSSNVEHTRLLAELTVEYREKTKRVNLFTLSLAGEPSPVSNLYLDHNSLQSIPSRALYNATGLHEIYLSFNNITELPAYAFGFSHRLTRVDLSYNQLQSIDNSTFQRHPKAFAGPFLIDYLDLSHNRLETLENNVFSYLVNLRILKLEHNRIYLISAHVWTGLYRLKYLDLSHNSIDNITQVFYSGYLNELNHLKITSNHLQQLDACEFLSLKGLTRLNLSGNNLTTLDTCSFYGLHRTTSHTPHSVHLSSNQLTSIHPCTFHHFARSTIHLGNNPLVCNCSFNYLRQNRQSLAYTGEECRGGFAYQSSQEQQQQSVQPAVRKTNLTSPKKPINISEACRDSFRYYNDLCSKLDCASQCTPNERFIIQVTTIPTPNGAECLNGRASFSLTIVVVVLIHYSHSFCLLYYL